MCTLSSQRFSDVCHPTHPSQLLGVINNVLDFSKIDSQRMVLEQRELELRKLLSGAFEVAKCKVWGPQCCSFVFATGLHTRSVHGATSEPHVCVPLGITPVILFSFKDRNACVSICMWRVGKASNCINSHAAYTCVVYLHGTPRIGWLSSYLVSFSTNRRSRMGSPCASKPIPSWGSGSSATLSGCSRFSATLSTTH
jgi:hypothetical protein